MQLGFTLRGFLFALALLGEPAQATAQDGLLSRRQFDQAHVIGNMVKPNAGTQPATIIGGVHLNAEEPSALIFGGDAKLRQHVVISQDLDQVQLPRESLTVEAWIRMDDSPDWGGICGVLQDNGDDERGWLLGSRGSTFSFALASAKSKRLTYLTSHRMFEEGQWYHVAGTYDGTLQRIYVDGRLAAETKKQTGPILYPTAGVYCMGAYRDDNEFHPFRGEIESVSVYQRALTADEIAAQFALRKSRFPGVDPVAPAVTDWPTYNRDNQRTGISEETIRFPLKQQWSYSHRLPPQPAWPNPANQDFWHNKSQLKARVTFDRAYHVVVADSRLYFGSSADDRVCCLDAKTGALKWSFFTEGPVRLAPTVSDGRVVFGSDDGCVYCLNGASGSLLWKYRHNADRRIPGNQRIISAWPIRSGVLVEKQIAYFCAGLFPKQGTFQVALDVRTGEPLASGPLSISPQGYLERKAGRLFVSTGRDPAGAFVTKLERRGKGIGQEVRQIPAEYPYAFIGAKGVRFGGGDGKVAAFDVEQGARIWKAEVEGTVYSLATAGGRLFASTDQGKIYCFAPTASGPLAIPPSPAVAQTVAEQALQQRYTDAAESILSHTKTQRGYCLLLGSADGRLAFELAQRTEMQIVGVEPDPTLVQQSRQMLEAAGLYGRVVIHHLPAESGTSLPYTDYMFNLVAHGALVSEAIPVADRDEVLRVLRPHGGVAVLGEKPTDVIRRAALPDSGDWTHMYANPANTVCSNDQYVGSQLELQWFGRPGPGQLIDRHHRTVAPLAKAGRMFVPGDNRVIAVDSYNGTVLWNQAIANSRRVGAFRDCSYMTATDDFLYVAAEGTCHMLDAQTGEQARAIHVPKVDPSKPRDWGYLASVGNHLYGSTTAPGASRRGHSRETIVEGTYFDFRPLVCSDSLFCVDRHSGQQHWHYPAKRGAIINSTITVGDGVLMFVESNHAASLDQASGRMKPSELLQAGSRVVALDTATGQVVWSQERDLSAIQHNIFGCYAEKKLVIVGTRNSAGTKDKAHVIYDLHVLDADTGKGVWSHSQPQPTKINGDHGEQDQHPVIVGSKLYMEPCAYDLHTGQPLADWGWVGKKRSGCGTISASASTLFFRQSNPTLFDLNTNQYDKVTAVTRPGCYINMIPAGGLLLIPEASSGCTCNYAIQTSLAFLPKGVQSEGK